MKIKTDISLLVLMMGVFVMSSLQLFTMETDTQKQQEVCEPTENAEATLSQEELEFYTSLYNSTCKLSLFDLTTLSITDLLERGRNCVILYNKYLSNNNGPIQKYSRKQWQYTSSAYRKR